MKRLFGPMHNENGSALLVAVLLVPVLTLFVVFASNITNQDTYVTINDNCHRDAFYNSDGGLYGAAKMIGMVGKVKTAPEIIAGTGGDAPGVIFHNFNADKNVGFRKMVVGGYSSDSMDVRDIEFIKVPGTDIGVQSLVDFVKRGATPPAGGGAEFGTGIEGVGTSLVKVLYQIRSQGRSNCTNTNVMVEGDYYMVAADIGDKGL